MTTVNPKDYDLDELLGRFCSVWQGKTCIMQGTLTKAHGDFVVTSEKRPLLRIEVRLISRIYTDPALGSKIVLTTVETRANIEKYAPTEQRERVRHEQRDAGTERSEGNFFR